MPTRDTTQSTVGSFAIHAALLVIMLFWSIPSAVPEKPLIVEFRLDSPTRVPDLSPNRISHAATAQPSVTPPRPARAIPSPGLPGSRIPRTAPSNPSPRTSTSLPTTGTSAPPRPRGGASADFPEGLRGDPMSPPRSGSGSTPGGGQVRRELTVPGEGAVQRQGLEGGKELGSGGSAGSAGSSASVDWGAGFPRQRIAGILPRYPRTAQGDVTVRIRFQVHPDGSVRNMVIVTKGEPGCEQAALMAIRTWKFAALPRDHRQDIQQAVVTFYFTAK